LFSLAFNFYDSLLYELLIEEDESDDREDELELELRDDEEYEE
jgi:hypothetical protein